MATMQYESKSSIWQCVLYFFACLSSLIFVKFKVPFTNSGEITFYIIELVGIVLLVFTLVIVVKKYKKLSKNSKILLWTVVISQIVFILIYVHRILFIGFELKSILILESNLFVISFYLLIVFGIIRFEHVLKSLSIFSAVFGVVSFCLIFISQDSYTDWILFASNQFSLLTFGNAIRTHILLICLPLSALYYFRSRNYVSRICFYIHLMSLIGCGMISGARVNYLCIPLAIILLSLIFYYFSKKNKWGVSISIIGISLIMVILVFCMSPYDMKVYTQMMRLDLTRSVMETLDIQYLGDDLNKLENQVSTNSNESSDLNDAIKQSQNSTTESSSSRSHMWKIAIDDIASAPLFGNGLKQYEFTFSNGTTLPMQAHNFILEYLLAFGILGFIFWSIMMLASTFLSLKKVSFCFWKDSSLCFNFCFILFACCGALFQPYFLYPCIMFYVFTLMGVFYSVSFENESILKK